MAWLSSWGKRIKLDIDYTDKIGASVTHFPVTIHLKDTNGNSTKVFEEVTTNSRKIAITKADGETELKGEIEQWDYDGGTPANSVAVIHTSITGWVINANTSIYLYYDNEHAVNANIGTVAGSSPVSDVWDGNFKGVWHLKDDPNTSTVQDSTSNENNGAKKAANEPTEVNGKIAKAQDYDGATAGYLITTTLNPSSELGNNVTYEVLVYPHAQSNYKGIIGDQSTIDEEGVAFTYINGWNFGYGDEAAWYQNPNLGDLTLNEWTYLAGTINVNVNVNIFKDGAQVGDPLSAGSSSIVHTTALVIGRDADDANNRYFDGIIDEVRISNVVRSAAWIKGSYNSGNDSLLAYGSEETPTVTISVSDTLSLSEDVKGNLTFKSSDSISLSDAMSALRTRIINVADTINISDKLLQLWRKLAKHTATWAHISKSESSPTYTKEDKHTSIWDFLTKRR